MIPSLKLLGSRELDDALHDLEGVTAKAVVRAALQKALVPVETKARAKVAVWSGALQRSIGIGTALTKRQRALRKPIAPVEAYVGPGVANKGGIRGVAHAHLVEFGTAHMAPQPFMRPAWKESIQQVWGRLAVEMSKALAAAVARAEKKARRNAR